MGEEIIKYVVDRNKKEMIRCKGIRNDKKQCSLGATFYGYCVTHYKKFILKKEQEERKNETIN